MKPEHLPKQHPVHKSKYAQGYEDGLKESELRVARLEEQVRNLKHQLRQLESEVMYTIASSETATVSFVQASA